MTSHLSLPIRGVATCLALVALLAFSTIQAKTPLLSSGGLFSVSDSGVASSSVRVLSRALGDAEKQFLSLTGFSTSDFAPIVVMLHASVEGASSLPSLRVDVMEGGSPRVKLDLLDRIDTTSDVVSDRRVRQLIVTALLLREYYGKTPTESGTSIPKFPPWVTCGLGQLCLSSQDVKSVAIPVGYLHGDAPPEIEAFLSQRVPEGENHAFTDLYEAMSAALLKAGLQGSGGKAFRNWVTQDGAGEKKRGSIPPWPPGWQMRPIERRWLLLMSGSHQGGESQTTTLMRTGETLAAYDRLISALPTPGHSIGLLPKEKGADYLIEQFNQRVAALRFRANPIAIPLVDNTTLFLAKLKRMPEKKIAPAEADLLKLRKAILKQSSEIEHYLDWYEAAKLPVRSGLFDRYLESPESTVKKGPVGRYLDAIEARGW